MFTQEDVSISRGYEGSGLGLSIARGLVKLLDGTIQVESEKEKGSVFTFTVPHNTDESASINIAKPKSAAGIRKPLVLIAEDEESNYLFLKIVMQSIQCELILAQNGADAVEICRQNQNISLVLMDIQMPVMNGIEATKKIHEFRPELPVIAITAYAQTGDESRFREAGCCDYLSKPVIKDTLIKLVQKYI